MRYWDTSALVPWLIDEPRTAETRRWLSEDPVIVTWALTALELTSAIERRVREGTITRPERTTLLADLAEIGTHWHEVTDLLAVRKQAALLLGRHPLRAADAAQLAAALLVANAQGRPITFVSFDQRLGEAAEREGLPILGCA